MRSLDVIWMIISPRSSHTFRLSVCDLKHKVAVWQGYALNHVDSPNGCVLDFYFEMPSALCASRTAEVMAFHSLQDPSGMRSTILFTDGYKPRL